MKKWVQHFYKSLNWQGIPTLSAWILEQAQAIQQIPAPTFSEKARAEYVQTLFTALGLTNVSMDEVFNVYGRLSGTHSERPALLLTAHTDTVFHHDTDLTLTAKDGYIYGAGLGDNSIGVSGMLAVAHYFQHAHLTPETDIWFVATTGEEGLGDLIGMRTAFNRLQARIGYVINVEGLALGHIYHAGIAVKRLKITAKTEGGHSWLHFGKTSAIHLIMQLGTRISNIHPPQNPRTTYNIGLVNGGLSINTIAPEAELWLDLRSEDQSALHQLEETVRGHVRGLSGKDHQFTIEVVGDRPAGHIPTNHTLVEGALASLDVLGLRGALDTGSTDGNIPLSHGCPTVTIGITRGGNAHRQDEFIEIAPTELGAKHIVLLARTVAYVLGEGVE